MIRRVAIAFALVVGMALVGYGADDAIGAPEDVIVNSTGDASDTNPGDDVCDTGGTIGVDAECTLRAAIEEANASSLIDTILFDIPTSDANWSGAATSFTISPTGTPLPAIAASTSIDGTTQSQWSGVDRPVIEISGGAFSGSEDGLELVAGTVVVRGLAIGDFPDHGIIASGGTGHTIAGNHIGVDATGVVTRPNRAGISAIVDSVVIGGTGPDDGNLIVGSSERGINIGSGADGVAVHGNVVGLDADGVAKSNQYGIVVNAAATNTEIGGPSTAQRNIVSGNWRGIRIAAATATTVQGNWIGTDLAGTGSTPNTGNGIVLDNDPVDVLIGGIGAGEGNIIRANGGAGIRLASNGTDDVAILGNSITASGGIGIDLDPNGVTANDAGDGDTGPNGLLNFPVLTGAAEVSGMVTVGFGLDVPDGDYRVEFFTNPSGADASGHGEGEVFAGYVDVTVTGGSPSPRSATFAGSAGDVLSATATEGTAAPFGATSEFSAVVTVVAGTAVRSIWASTDANAGAPGADGLPSGWLEGDALEFGGPDIALGDATDGELSVAWNVDPFLTTTGDVHGLHYVETNITVGGGANTFDLQVGDLLLTLAWDRTILGAYSWSGSNETVNDQDVLVFRPTAPGNYTSGTFHLLLDDLASEDHLAVTLVETATTVGGVALDPGDFLFIEQGVTVTPASADVHRFEPTGVGAGTTTGTQTTLIDGSDIGLDPAKPRALDLIEAPTVAGGLFLPAGTLLFSPRLDGNVGDNGIAVTRNDIVGLDVTAAGTDTVADAFLVLDGSDVNIDLTPGTENLYALTLIPTAGNTAPTSVAGGPYSIAEGDDLDTLDGSGSSDADTDPLAYRWDLDGDGHYDDATGITPTVSWATLTGLGLDDDGGPFTIGLEVDDGIATDTSTTTLTITNTAPTVTVTGSGSASAGTLYTVSLSVTDPGADTVSAWRIDWGDGSFSNLGGNPASAGHTYTTPAFREIRAAVTDEDGTFNATTVMIPQYDGDTVVEISSATGDALRTFSNAALNAPVDATVAPDGYLYAVGNISENVVRFDVGTGAFDADYIPTGTGGLAGPGWILIRATSEAWVSAFGTDSIKSYDLNDGSYVDEVVPAGLGGLTAPTEMTIGPDGDLYVASWATDSVHRYDAESGVALGVFASTNLDQPTDLTFGPDGDLYVTNFGDGAVRRFDGTTGAFDTDVVSLSEAYGITFGPDGLMYVTSQGLHRLNVYDTSGTLLSQLSDAGDGLSGPSSFDFVPSHVVTVGPADSDGDGLFDHHEDANTDADDDPVTTPGPNTDGDANPNYLDADDDGDGTPTALEHADPNGDGDPRDAADSDRDTQPDYLDPPTTGSLGTVADEQVISETLGDLTTTLGVNDHFGRAIAPIGDLDGDGINDLAVGAPNDDDGSSDRGAVYVLFMDADGTVASEQKISDTSGGFTAVLDNADEFGISVTGLGDLDGDGVNDIAVGAHQDDDGANGNGGAVYVLFMNRNGTVRSYQKICETDGGLGVLFDANDRFGGSVANIGDLDGDGLNDIVVGAKDDDDGIPNAGAVYVLFLEADGTVDGHQKISQTTGGLTGSPLGGSDGFGIGVAGLGDVDGDGNGDIAVGTYWDDDGGTNHGAAYVLFLDTDGTVTGQQKISDTQGGFTGTLDSNDEFGTAVGATGDVDADGVPDLIVGTPKDDDGNTISGAAYLLFLDTDGSVKRHQKISNLEGDLGITINTSDQFGFAVAGLGDLDGDGTIGLAVGTYGDDDGFVNSGSVYVLDLAIHNGAPTAVPGGPYSTGEGDGLVLDGSGSSDPETDPLTYRWDVDNDGNYDDATGANPTVAWLTLVGLGFDDDGGPYPIGLEVDDGNGNVDTATVNWTLANTPPEILVTGSSTVGRGSNYTANLSANDPGDDTVTEWTINWGDGTVETIPGNPASATHTYATPGEYNITAAVEDEDSVVGRPWHNGDMVVPGLFGNEQLYLLEATTGALGPNLAVGSGQGWALAAAIGPDGLAYVGDYTNDTIRRYNPATQQDLGVWIAAGTGGLDGPAGLEFGPDGHLYVSSNFSDQILEFDTDGTFLGVFASGGGLDEPDDLTFGPDGNLYVTSFNTDQVLEFNGRDGNPMGVFASGPAMDQPSELTFDSSGRLYVTSVANDQVVRYDADGNYDRIFAAAGATGLDEPRAAVFGPDGHLYVGGRNRIVRYDGSTGTLIDTYLPSGSIAGPSQSAFVPARSVTVLPLIVNSTGDASDSNPGDGVCFTGGTNSAMAPECTLRAAIEEANVLPGTDTISFDMPVGEAGHSGGIWTISPGSDFDQLGAATIIDGRTQTGWTSSPIVEIDGTGAPTDGFRIGASRTEIHGLAINRFPGDGIEVVSGAQDLVIAANHIGLDATGLIGRANGGHGINLGAGSGPTRVGGTELKHRNLISGNGGDGIRIDSSNANTVFNNYIGTDITGMTPIANAADGIGVTGTSGSNVIGQTGDVNILSGNAEDGVESTATGVNNAVFYNIVGLGADASTPVANGRYGVLLRDGATTTFVYQNLIAGNTNSGVVIDGDGNALTAGNFVIGNWIGLDLSNQPRPNGGNGVHIFDGASGNYVGGTPAAYRNTISGNTGNGVLIAGATTSGNEVANNHIGTTIAGDAAVANGDNGVRISGAPNTTIGGTTAAHRNVISGNANNGILLDGATATGNTIQGNHVGTNAAGDAAVPNADEGVDLSDAPGNLVGGDAAGAGNVISGNGQDGVLLIGGGTTANFVSGNSIGTNAAGDAALPNGRAGVYVQNGANANDIGGPAAAWGNVISGNTEDGIYLTDAGTTLNRLSHNYIGTNAAGDGAVPNGDRGVQVESGASANFIGDVGRGNVISGNAGDGIIVADFLSLGTSDNSIVENLVGVAADGNTPLGNGANGVHIDPAADTLIATNTIAHNAWDGVLLEPAALSGNSIVGNSIHSNGQLGIDLGNDGVTTNSNADAWVNHPVITSATAASGTITVDFDIDLPAGDYRIEFFDNTAADVPSGYGEGETWVDSYDVITHPGGPATHSTTIPGVVGDIITATATEGTSSPYGSTSEFSAAAVVTLAAAIVNSTGDSGDALPGDGVCDTGSTNSQGATECTLRAAIEETNGSPTNAIHFDIPATEAGHSSGVWTISPNSPFDLITATVTIDGRTQTGWSSTPVVELNGSSAGVGMDGLRIAAADVEIRSLAINRFQADGIEVDSAATGTVITGNHIGLDASGLIDRGNGGRGIDLQTGSGPTTVGGTDAADRNVISGNGGDGIIVWNTSNNTIIGNYLGTDVTGNASGTGIGNGADGIAMGLGSANNTIGQPGAGNVLSGNANDGFENDATGAGNSVRGNMIGLGADGTTVVANGRFGVVIYNGANNTSIGGAGAGEGNVISGNVNSGVIIDGNNNPATTANTIVGNLIGTDSSGALNRGNGGSGIHFFSGATGNTIGGTGTDEGNVVSANGDYGIDITGSGTDANIVVGNLIGTDGNGTSDLGNATDGVAIRNGAENNVIGGTAAGSRNIISGNDNDGVWITGTGTESNTVQGNWIGYGSDDSSIANSYHGVGVENGASNNLIGGTTAAAANRIGNSAWDGVAFAFGNGNGNAVLRNEITANGGLGIDIDNDDVTPNDSPDTHAGPNDRLNYPVITSAVEVGGVIDVDFDLDVPAGDYRIEFFDNTAADVPSGYGEGETWVDSYDVISHPGGLASYNTTIPGGAGDIITATTTEAVSAPFGSTSEFSAAVTVVAGDPIVNSGGNAADAAPGNGLCDTGATNSEGDPECTLDAAIAEANALGGSLTIEFAIPDSDPGYRNLGAGLSYWRIQPSSSITPLTAGDIILDATTQTTFAVGQGYFVNDLGPEVEINNSNGAGGYGLEVQSSGNQIRGFVVNGFVSGIALLAGDANVIAGNYLGPDPSGANGLVGNTEEGIQVYGATNTRIGGTAVADRNVISGNRQRGVLIDDWSDGAPAISSGTQILGNYIGTNAAGDAALPYDATNDQEIGVYVLNSPATTVGSPTAGNVISGNEWYGLYAFGSDMAGGVVQGNIVGLDAGASGAVPNATDPLGARSGIYLSNTVDVAIGGVDPGDGNIVAGNAGFGVIIGGASATDNPVLGNSTYDNAELGIDLGADGVTLNDSPDDDLGPNDLLNFPVVTAATELSGIVTVDFGLDVPDGDYRIELFTNSSGADPSGHGEGETVVATVDVTVTSGVPSPAVHSFAGSTGDVITATATEDLGGGSYGSTSEFSAALTVADGSTSVPDSSVRRADLRALGGPATIVAGAAGDAVDLDGVDDRLAGPGLDVTDSGLRLGAWVQLDAVTGDDVVISKRDTSGNAVYELGVDGVAGGATATIRVSGAAVTVSGGAVGTGGWHHLAASWDGAELVLFVDGSEVDRTAAAGTLATDPTTDATVGARDDGSRRLDGRVDHITIGHDPFTADEVAVHHDNVSQPTLVVSVGAEQQAPPGAWTTSTDQSRSGSSSLSAPEASGSGDAAWAVANGLDEPGIVFESWWWMSTTTGLDVAAGSRAGASPTDQYSGALGDGPLAWELRQRVSDSEVIDATTGASPPTGSWVEVELHTDQDGDSRLFVGGVEVHGATPQGAALSSGSAALLVDRLPVGEHWYVDDARARKLATPEPVTSVGRLDRR